MLYRDFLEVASESRRQIDPFLEKVDTRYRRS
jgi:hypothetical protein